MLLFNKSIKELFGDERTVARTLVNSYTVGLWPTWKCSICLGMAGTVVTNCWNRLQDELKSVTGALATWWGKLLVCRICNISSVCYQIQAIPVDFLLLGSRAEISFWSFCLYLFLSKVCSVPMCNLEPPWQVSSQCASPCLCIWGSNQAKERKGSMHGRPMLWWNLKAVLG